MLTLICLGYCYFYSIQHILFCNNENIFSQKISKLIISLIKNGNSLHFKNLYKTKEKKTFNMIIDCFPFFNELDLLEIRLKLLDDIVDRVVLVESTRTFSLRKKKLYYLENKDRFKRYNSKITHIIVDDTPAFLNRIFLSKPRNLFWLIKNKKSILLNPHHIDFYQKNKVINGLENCQADDIIILSDLDEIPNPNIFNEISFLKNGAKGALELENFCFFLNGKLYDNKNSQVFSYGPAILEFKNFRSFHAERKEARSLKKEDNNHNFEIIKNAGWHFGYLGGVDKVRQKILSAAHVELSTNSFNTRSNIEKHINKGLFIVKEKNWKINYKPLDNLFQKNICKVLEKYPSLLKLNN